MKAPLSSSGDHRFGEQVPAHCIVLAACLVRPGPEASNDLLSVLATLGQTPHPVFAQWRTRQAHGGRRPF